MTTNSGTHVALRVDPSAAADAWWAAARKRRDAPPAVGALLSGRSRVEITVTEADQALAWASGIEGWSGATPKPLFVHGANGHG